MSSHGPLNTAPACSECRAERSWLGRAWTFALTFLVASYVIRLPAGYMSSMSEFLGVLFLLGLFGWYALRPFVVCVGAWFIRWNEHSTEQKPLQCSQCHKPFLYDVWPDEEC